MLLHFKDNACTFRDLDIALQVQCLGPLESGFTLYEAISGGGGVSWFGLKRYHFISFFFQRAAASERQTEQLRQQLITIQQSQREGDNPHKATADMDKAIDMLQRSSLEVELAAKEKEVNI